jgi:hypothetical protein
MDGLSLGRVVSGRRCGVAIVQFSVRGWRAAGAWLGLVAVLVAGCEPEGGGGGGGDPGNQPQGGKRCRTRFVAPYSPFVASGSLIKGEARASCQVPPTSHVVTLYLEVQDGGAWRERDKEVSAQLPPPEGFGLLVLTECAAGRWRLRFTVTASADGQTANAKEVSDTLVVRSQGDCANVRR